MPVVTVTNQKGGVGKTTSTLNLAVALRRLGYNVLAVDFDPQGNLSTCAGLTDVNVAEARFTLADALLTTVRGPSIRKVTLADTIVAAPAGIDVVPADKHLAAAEAALYTVYGREFALRDTLATVKDRYDVILVDSVPTLGLLAINALSAANGILIPVQADYLAVHGLSQLLESVSVVRERLNPDLEVWGVLLTMVDPRTKHSREVVAAVRESLPGKVNVFEAQIPVHVRLKDSAKAGVSIFSYDPGSKAAMAYHELAKEIAPRLGEPGSALSAAGISSLLDGKAAPPPMAFPDGATAATASYGPTDGSDGETTAEDDEPSEDAPRDDGNALTIGPRTILTQTSAETPVAPNGKRHPGICPRLGVVGDPSRHLNVISAEHRCFADDESLEISSYAQRLYCLTDRYGTCGRYLRSQMKTQAETREQAPSFMDRVKSVLTRG
jgi:chromosome partitioning protein